MSIASIDIATQLKSVLDARDEQGFVDLSQIHKLVAPVDQRDTIMLLSPKKIADVRARLTTTDFDPVRLENDQVFVFYELALDIIAFRRADLKNVVQKWKGELGSALGQIISAVPELALRVDEVFGGTGIRYTRIDGKFYFAATDMAKLVLWDEETRTPSQNNIAFYLEGAKRNDDALKLAFERTFQFRGQGQKAVPIIDINDTARLWINLPGAKATAFRTQIISKWVRVFGGDLSLIDEITQNRAIQEDLPEYHPARAFGDAVHVRSSDAMTFSEMDERMKAFQAHLELQRQKDRDDMMKAIENVGTSIENNMNRIDALVVNRQVPDLQCHYAHLVKSIDDVATGGVSDYSFRAEFNGFCATIANVFYDTLQQNTATAAASLIKDVMNVEVHFARPMVRWSSLCTRTLFQGCLVLRVRQWICQERGLTYPNDAIKLEIQHSTYLNLQCYFSLLSHLDRVWEERNYDGFVVLRQMICALLSKFGADLIAFDVDQKIDYHYGARKASNTPQSGLELSNDQGSTFTTFLKTVIDEKINNYIRVSFLWDHYTKYATEHGLPPINSRGTLVRSVNSVNVPLTRSPKSGRVEGWIIVRPKTEFQKFLQTAAMNKRYISVGTLWALYNGCTPALELPVIGSESELIKFVNTTASDVGYYTEKEGNRTIGWTIAYEVTA